MVYTKKELSLMQCAYCKKLCCHEEYPYLTCEMCSNNIHIRCLKNGDVPGSLVGDVFFTLHCAECTDGHETIKREKIPWITVAILTLYHLSKTGHGKSGFFHFSNHICDFIDTNYTHLFPSAKKTKNWKGTLAGVLSSFNHSLIESGFSVLGESGWWKLIHDLPPIVILNDRISTAERKRNKVLAKSDDPVIQPKNSEPSENLLLRSEKKAATVKMLDRDRPSTSRNDMFSQAYVAPSETLSNFLFEEDADDIDIEGDEIEAQDFDGGFQFDFSMKERMTELLELDDNSQNGSVNQEPQKTLPQTRDSTDTESQATVKTQDFSEEENSNLSANELQKLESEAEEESENEARTLSTPPPKSLFTILPPEVRTNYAWEIRKDAEEGSTNHAVPISFFEESQLYERLRRAAISHKMPEPVNRLYRKLSVRHLKRQLNLPLFNIDGGNAEPLAKRKQTKNSKDSRVLDRFQNFVTRRVYRESLFHPDSSFADRLNGYIKVTNFYSPYTQRLLKAYIWRDEDTVTPWMKLMEEMQIKANRKNPDWKLPDRLTIDYCYVRPQHISSVNNLCKEFFYPGIDLSETLSYPDFTCVTLYKKLVVGFAFMVPDTGFNETYISFLFTRPGWRASGIATFMLYHLIQTCMGKDITLHVSATNPALLLYQKFGFKVEEFIQDFYYKYLPPDSKECKHALYLRLSR